jgi:hypothetical protein
MIVERAARFSRCRALGVLDLSEPIVCLDTLIEVGMSQGSAKLEYDFSSVAITRSRDVGKTREDRGRVITCNATHNVGLREFGY